jgi:predicted kinase
VAEREGFEPSEEFAPLTSLAGKPVQPDSGTSPTVLASIPPNNKNNKGTFKYSYFVAYNVYMETHHNLQFPEDVCVIMIGVSGSGKSTIAERICEFIDGGVILSSDHIREIELGVKEYDPALNSHVFSLLHQRLEDRMQKGLPTIVDSTALEKDKRLEYVKIAQKHERPIVIFISDPGDDTAWARNVTRSMDGGRFVPEDAFARQQELAKEVRRTIRKEAQQYGYHDVVIASPLERFM